MEKDADQQQKKIRIVVADDHPVVTIGVGNMLAEFDRYEVVGIAYDGETAIAKVKQTQPDILLLDIEMPKKTGLKVVEDIVHDGTHIKILLLTSSISAKQTIEALNIGARGVVLKNVLAQNLTSAIDAAYEGDYWIEGRRVSNLVSAIEELKAKVAPTQKTQTYGLTRRELEVVGCIVEGYTNRDIANRFSLSEETVKRHLSNIFDKTGVSTRLELALFAIAHHLVPQKSN